MKLLTEMWLWLLKILTAFNNFIQHLDARFVLLFLLFAICAFCILKLLQASLELFWYALVLTIASQPIQWLLTQIQNSPTPHK